MKHSSSLKQDQHQSNMEYQGMHGGIGLDGNIHN
jgi:hypothetical protein